MFLDVSIYANAITNLEDFMSTTQEHIEDVYNMEPLLTGHKSFTKYNGNNGYVINDPKDAYNKLMQTFSHYSYYKSHRNLLICDSQGCYDDDFKQLILTDPAIHCKIG